MTLLRELFNKQKEITFIEYNDLENGLIILQPANQRQVRLFGNLISSIEFVKQDSITLTKEHDKSL